MSKPSLAIYKSPQTVVAWFIARKNYRSAGMWALIFGAFLASKAVGYANTYPSAMERAKLVATFSNNIGLKVILGAPRHLETVAGFSAWNTGGVMMIIGAIWGFLLASRVFRGEEDAGRWELFLSGQTTARQAAGNVLAGLAMSLFVLFVVMAAVFTMVGRVQTVGYAWPAGVFFALVISCVTALFISVGAFCSQLMSTRGRAAGLAALIFGACFLVRSLADTTNASWLLNVTPLGWAEKAQPLAASQPIWLMPIIVLTIFLSVLTVYLAGQRDLGASLLVDKDTSRPHLELLNNQFFATLRLNRASIAGWLLATMFVSLFFGVLTKSATQAFSESQNASSVIGRLVHNSQAAGTSAFLSIVFFMIMTLIMLFAASGISAVRAEEATGYLDNILVRAVRRLSWLAGRLAIVVASIAVAGLGSGAIVWLGMAGQNLNVSLATCLQAGLNAVIPALLVTGAGLFAIGVLPRQTSLIVYALIAWSFLIEMVSSGLKLNHWVLDTSIFNHIILAPAATPNWTKNTVLIVVSAVFVVIGMAAFSSRDIKTE